jgi:hypothetical protein
MVMKGQVCQVAGVVNQGAPAFTGDVDRTFQLFVKLFETTYFGVGLLY